MSWWKRSNIENFDDRNDVNAQINKLIALSELLRYSAKLIFQTARGARALTKQVATNKSISSFPEVIKLLDEADRVAMDNPHKFGDYCKSAAQLMEEKVANLQQDRTKWTHEKNPNQMKGWPEDE